MWYRTGSISLTNGSTAVTGSGTAWIANAGVGEAIYGPDGKLYEIATISSDTSITLATAYLGTTASAQPYVIVPSQSYIRDLANQAAELINEYATVFATAGAGKFGDGSLSSPSVQFISETNTGFYKSATNEVTYVANGIAQFKYNLSGLTVITGLTLPTSDTPAQTTEGSVVWDSDSDLLTVGTGSGRKTMVDTDSTQTLTNKTLTSPNLSNPSISGTIAGASLTLSGNTTIGDGSDDVVTINGSTTANAPVVIAANSSSNALRITQTGSGNALVVEDSANPDSSPFVIDSAGRAIIGSATSQAFGGSISPILQTHGTTSNAGYATIRWSANAGATNIVLAKSRGASVGTLGAVSSGDGLGYMQWQGDDGTAFIPAAYIYAEVDGTPGTNDMPGRLVLSTTRDGASSPTEAMRITSSQNSLFGRTYSSGERIGIGGGTSGLTSGTVAYGINNDTVVSSAQTNTYSANNTYVGTQAAAFTLSNLQHYRANFAGLGSGSAITNQYGYFADGSLTGATNNYGFYSNIASGTGRWNFYAAGSADNYFAGNVGIGGLPSANLDVLGSGSSKSIRAYCTDTTGSNVGSVSAAFGTGAANSIAMRAGNGYTSLVSNGASDPLIIGTAATERMRIDSAGIALIGLTSATGVAKLQVSGPIKTTGYTVATLPAGTVGMRTYVTDAMVPVALATVAGGGSSVVPVFYNGTNWIVA